MQPCLQAVARLGFAKTEESSSAEQGLHMVEVRKPALIVSIQRGDVQRKGYTEHLDDSVRTMRRKLVRAC